MFKEPKKNSNFPLKLTYVKYLWEVNDAGLVWGLDSDRDTDELVSSLEMKMKKLEEEVLDMREWAKFLLSAIPTLETNMDMSPFTSQVTLQNNPPPDYSTSQSQPSSIQIPPKNIYFPNHPYPPQHHAYAPKPQHLTLHPHHPTR